MLERMTADVERDGPLTTSVLAQAVPYHGASDLEGCTLVDARVRVVLVEDAVRLVTLDDPKASPQAARGAFARLRAPEGMSAPETASWRDSVAAYARAVRVVAAPRAAAVALTSARADVADEVLGVREEATALAAATEDPQLIAFVERILSEVDHA